MLKQYLIIALLLIMQNAVAQEILSPIQEKSGKWGYKNQEGKLIVACRYSKTYAFFNGLGIVEKNGKQGIVNTDGELVLKCKYYSISILDNKRIAVGDKENKFALFYYDGEKTIALTSFDYNNITNFFANFFIVYLNNYGIVDSLGKLIIEPEYTHIEKINRYLFRATDSLKIATIYTMDGKKITEAGGYSNTYLSNSEMIMTERKTSANTYYGLLDKYGNRILACEYSDIL